MGRLLLLPLLPLLAACQGVPESEFGSGLGRCPAGHPALGAAGRTGFQGRPVHLPVQVLHAGGGRHSPDLECAECGYLRFGSSGFWQRVAESMEGFQPSPSSRFKAFRAAWPVARLEAYEQLSNAYTQAEKMTLSWEEPLPREAAFRNAVDVLERVGGKGRSWPDSPRSGKWTSNQDGFQLEVNFRLIPERRMVLTLERRYPGAPVIEIPVHDD